MSTTVEINAEPDSPQTAAAQTPGQDERKWTGVLEQWLSDHLNAVALMIVAAGLVARVIAATGTYLNPDEALHYLLINQTSAFLAYKASLTNAHPPLFFLLTYYWHFLGRSELMLRLPSILAGAALCWATFKWIGIVFGRVTGLIALAMTAFSPSLIALSVQVRDYMFLLFFTVAALYFLGRAMQQKSVPDMWYFSIFLYLAILTHYSAAFFALAAGLYALAFIADTRPPVKIIFAWAVGQLGALAIYAFLFFSHVSKVEDSIPEWSSPYSHSYYRGGFYEDLLTFTREHTIGIFNFMFEQKYFAMAMLVFFLITIAFLVGRDLIARDTDKRSRHLSILLLVPFAAVWGASIAGVYPYVGTRHTVFLEPFAIASASFLFAALCRQKLWTGIPVAISLIVVLIAGAPRVAGQSYEPFITRGSQSRALMIAATNAIQQSVPPGDLILVDYQSSVLLAYYLCGPNVIVPTDATHSKSDGFNCGGHPVVSTTNHVWKLTPGNLSSEFGKMARVHRLDPGDPVWVFQAGWESNLDASLPEHVMKFRCLTSTKFGDNISIIPFVVGPDFLPAVPSNLVGNCGSQ